MKTKHIKSAAVKSLCKEHGRRISEEAMHIIDDKVRRYIHRCADMHNGGKKTIDVAVVNHCW